MPHAQARMAPLLDIARRSAKAKNQKLSQPLLGPRQVLAIHRPQNIVLGNLAVERPDQMLKTFLADCGVYVLLLHLGSGPILPGRLGP